MERDKILTSIQVFLREEKEFKIKHSLDWQNRMVEKVKKNPKKRITTIYKDMIIEFINETTSNVIKQYRVTHDMAKLIADTAFEIFLYEKIFDGSRGVEDIWIQNICVKEAYGRIYQTTGGKKNNSRKVGQEDVWDESTSSIIKKDKWVNVYPTNFEFESESSNDDDEWEASLYESILSDNNEERESNNEYAENEFSFESDLSIEPRDEDIEKHTSIYDFEINETENKIDCPKRQEHLSSAERLISAKKWTEKSIGFLYKYYLLKGVATHRGINNLPSLKKYPDMSSVLEVINVKDKPLAIQQTTNYFHKRYKILKEAEKRFYMELCINLMKKGRKQLDIDVEKKWEEIEKWKKIPELKKEENGKKCDYNWAEKWEKKLKKWEADSGKKMSLNLFKEECRKKYPILSAVAVDAQGKIIGSCFKGQIENELHGERLTFQKHCEYTLLEEIILPDDIVRLKGGTLYVTLEPCNKRDYFINKDGEEEPYIPCAVRCLESGISKIYIGIYDTNKNVHFRGIRMLREGKYRFRLKEDGSIDSAEKNKEDVIDEIKSQELMEQYLKNNLKNKKNKKRENYIDSEEENEEGKQRVYTIRDPGIELDYFDTDLMKEIYEINKEFLDAQKYKIPLL